ncbi:hypothetical protein MUK42_37745 [Musa troglodytarum]|uniref:Uncharacterized protein n=1 Tax=Musa troglodytarum TaxID=320322 RepID=A0A9E7GD18_9LILI|nr:hypothetical protein MUK42_37745 [Musa troglodytarum]
MEELMVDYLGNWVTSKTLHGYTVTFINVYGIESWNILGNDR